MTGQGIQKKLFKREETEEDQAKDFLRAIFRSCSQIYSFKLLEEVFQEFTFELEAERLMEEEALREIEEENDF